jgi:anti-sigma regulatory factor (Ser/Thr protein kinase)
MSSPPGYAHEAPPAYAHEAIFVGSEEELVNAAAPFLGGGLENNEAVGVVSGDSTGRLLCDALGNDSRIALLPHDRVFRDAQTAVGAYREFTTDRLAAGYSRVRLIGEVDFAAFSSWHEWALFEAAADDVLSSSPVWNVCLYDTRMLADSVLLTGELAHPFLRMGGHRLTNPQYVPPSDMLARPPLDAFDPIELTPPTLEILDVGRRSAVRQQVRHHLAEMAVFPEAKVEPFVLAVHEVVGNALVHGQGPVDFRLWVAGGRAVCTVTDRGQGFPVDANMFSPRPSAALPESGLGLYIVRELVDAFHGYLTPNGFVVRLGVEYVTV